MLVLKRRVDESIIIDNKIEIKILGNSKDVRVGINAPRYMNIAKAESKNKIKKKSGIENDGITTIY